MARPTRKRQPLPFGSWPSPLSATEVARAGVRHSDVQVLQGSVYWSERRPQEEGRSVIVRYNLAPDLAQPTGPAEAQKTDVVARNRNVRSRAHEYGGACYLILPREAAQDHAVTIAFADFATHTIFLAPTDNPTRNAERVLLEDPTSAYADFTFDQQRSRLICAREHYPTTGEPIASLVSLALDQQQTEPTMLIDSKQIGCDFVSTPRVSPDGTQLAWIAWKHPNMPWDASELWLADLDRSGVCRNPRLIAGNSDNDRAESIFQPEWSPDGLLHFVSDQNGWWNIYRLETSCETGAQEPRCLTPMEAEFGLPQWVFGMSTYKIPRSDMLVAICSQNGLWSVGTLDPSAKDCAWQAILGPFTQDTDATGHSDNAQNGDTKPPIFSECDSVAADRDLVALIAAGPNRQPSVLAWSLDTLEQPPQLLGDQAFSVLNEASIALGQAITFNSPHTERIGPDQEPHTCHAFYYAPSSSDYRGKNGERPPLIVKSHGGPTAATSNALDPAIQFWTSRGFAVVDVNYSGSTGYGRAYRDRLHGNWGLLDVEDCAAAALHLVDIGLADPDRLIIRGGSAGGFTTLAALTFTKVFRAGASLYGIGDLEALAQDTHKFESRYLERMIGPYPQARDLYRERSPIHSADRLSCPVIFFQGTEDKVVPPSQSEAMVHALQAKGVATSYVLFQGEGHGFRRAENIVEALEKELAFYATVFGLTKIS